MQKTFASPPAERIISLWDRLKFKIEAGKSIGWKPWGLFLGSGQVTFFDIL